MWATRGMTSRAKLILIVFFVVLIFSHDDLIGLFIVLLMFSFSNLIIFTKNKYNKQMTMFNFIFKPI
jgi:hypothetical protein